MATGHALSIVTNSAVKLPRKTKSKLACSFTERDDLYTSSGDENFNNTWPERQQDGLENDRFAFTDRKLTSHMTNAVPVNSTMRDDTDTMFHTLTHELANLSDDQFYDKLLEMKTEHRKTLNSLESAYNSRHNSPFCSPRDVHDPPEKPILRTSHLSQSGPIYNNGIAKEREITDQLNQFNQSMPAWSALKKDNVRDMSAKPPSGRPKSAWSDRKNKYGQSLRSSGRTSRSDWEDITWSGASDSEHETSYTSEAEPNTTGSTNTTGRAFADSPAAVVENMWDHFSVEDYAPRSRSGSESRASIRSNRSTTSKTSKKSQEWSPKITVPKPFTMTVRDANREKKKSRAAIEIEQELEEKKKAEEAECQKQFKANPAPATTYLPLYDELMEKQEEKSRMNQELGKEILKTTQKPFKFTKREEEKKRHRTRSLPLSTPDSRAKAKKQFKARPVPKSVHDPTVSERILEEEEYRKIRIQMRAEEMLRSSSLPQNMQIRGKEYTDGRLRQKMQKSREKKAFMTEEHKFHPKVKGDVPDYDELYRKFQTEVYKKKQTKEPTVVQPFNLRTARIPSKKDKILEDMRFEEESRKEKARYGTTLNKSGSMSLRRSLSASADSIPLKTTAASELRKSATERSIQDKLERVQAELERERQRRLKEKKLHGMINQKALANDKSETLSMTNQKKLRQYRQAERSRREEYEQELQEIQSRVESRPFLFERETQTSAKKKAERKYQQALRNAGIDEDFLVRKSRGGGVPGGSVVSRDSYGDDDDFEQSDSVMSAALNSARSNRSGRSRSSARRSVYSDDDSDDAISSIHSEFAEGD